MNVAYDFELLLAFMIIKTEIKAIKQFNKK